jgi:membrane-bound lytic murein transglycosylase A
VPFTDLPGWAEDTQVEALAPLLRSCDAWRAMRTGRVLGSPGLPPGAGSQPADWAGFCVEARAIAAALPRARPSRRGRPPTAAAERAAAVARNELVRAFLERRTQAFAAGTGLLTGYYEPELRGAAALDDAHTVPLLGRPPPPAAGERLPDRGEIAAGALAGRGLELLWLDDAADAYLLHIQGSGRVQMSDGRVLRVGYAGQNGRPFRPIGRVLIERGALPRSGLSARAIRDWLRCATPETAAALVREDPSYIFFRVVEGLRPDQGPVGALGVSLTPERSLAVDPAFVPLGAPVWVAAARDPGTPKGTPLRRLVLAQDTGGAIRGPARGDLFRGWGEAALSRADRLSEPVEMYVLLPRAEVERPPGELIAEAPPPAHRN